MLIYLLHLIDIVVSYTCNPRWWNGRHEGLKILYRKMYEFESRLGDSGLVAQWKSSALLRHWSWVQIPLNPFHLVFTTFRQVNKSPLTDQVYKRGFSIAVHITGDIIQV